MLCTLDTELGHTKTQIPTTTFTNTRTWSNCAQGQFRVFGLMATTSYWLCARRLGASASPHWSEMVNIVTDTGTLSLFRALR